MACRSTLQGHHSRQATTPRAGPTPSPAYAAAILSGRVGAPNVSHRASLPGDRGPDLPGDRGPDLPGDRGPHNSQVRFDADYPRWQPARRPAPSRNSPKFLLPALQSAGMLRPLPSLGAFSRPTFLFRLMSPSITTSSAAGSPTPAAAPTRHPGPLPPSSPTAPKPSRSCRHVLSMPSLQE